MLYQEINSCCKVHTLGCRSIKSESKPFKPKEKSKLINSVNSNKRSWKENVRRHCPKFWRQKNRLASQHCTISHFLVQHGLIGQKQQCCHSTHSLTCSRVTFLSSPDWRSIWKTTGLTKQKCRQCWTSLQTTNSRMCFKKTLVMYMCKVTTSWVLVARRPKVSFWPDSSTSPKNFGCHLLHWIFTTVYFSTWNKIRKQSKQT